MGNMNVFFSPLEQFEILPVISFYLNGLDFSITNETVILLLIFFFTATFFLVVLNNQIQLYMLFLIDGKLSSKLFTKWFYP